ncbi:MAG: O-antigen ligase family protein [Polyangiaceae bacterium]
MTRWLDNADRATSAALACSVVGSVLAIGAVHHSVLVVIGAVSAVSAATALAVHDRSFRPLLPALIAGGLAAYTMLQAFPAPRRVVAFLAASNADVWQRALLPFSEPAPEWVSISLDPGASAREALKWFTYAATLATAAIVARRRGLTWGIGTVFIAGLAAALTTLAHGLVGATSVYGLYEPTFPAAAWHVGPLLNPNNLAGYLNLSTLCGLGLMLSATPPAPRWLIGIGLATIIGVEITSASRGGVLLLPVGVLGLAILLRLRRSRRHAATTSTTTWLLFSAVGGGAVLAALGGTESTWRELFDKNAGKFMMLAWAVPLIRDHPWWGIGRGAFESVFPAYRSEPGTVFYSHAENFPTQWASEWGLPVACAALLGFLLLLRPSVLGVGRSVVAGAAWIGVIVLALHNFADLALEVPGVMIAMVTVVGSLVGAARGKASRATRTGARGRFALAVALAVPILGLSAVFGRHDVGADRAWVHSLYAGGDGARDADRRIDLRRALRESIMRHPADPYFPLVGALVAWRANDANPIPWLARTLERGRGNGRAHLTLAEVLAARGKRGQALLEVRLAAESDPSLVAFAATAATSWTRRLDELAATVPDGPTGAVMAETLASLLLRPEERSTRRALLHIALARDPERIAASVAMAEELLVELSSSGDEACVPISQSNCIPAIEGHARVVERKDPRSSAAPRLRAKLLSAMGRSREAEALLAERCASVTDRAPCLWARVLVAAEVKPPAELPSSIKQYLSACCTGAEDCARATTAVGDLEVSRGELNSALGFYRRAAGEASSEALWLKIADVASRIGEHAQALEALERVSHIRGKLDAELDARIQRERAAALGDPSGR